MCNARNNLRLCYVVSHALCHPLRGFRFLFLSTWGSGLRVSLRSLATPSLAAADAAAPLAMGMSPAPRAGFNRPEADCGRDESARPPQADELRGNRPPTRAATTSYRVRSTQIPRYPETTAQNYPPPLLLAYFFSSIIRKS